MWKVECWIKGSAKIVKHFSDKPSAHRWAQNMVEVGPSHFATVDKV